MTKGICRDCGRRRQLVEYRGVQVCMQCARQVEAFLRRDRAKRRELAQ